MAECDQYAGMVDLWVVMDNEGKKKALDMIRIALDGGDAIPALLPLSQSQPL